MVSSNARIPLHVFFVEHEVDRAGRVDALDGSVSLTRSVRATSGSSIPANSGCGFDHVIEHAR
jgi:hypothetical protein